VKKTMRKMSILVFMLSFISLAGVNALADEVEQSNAKQVNTAVIQVEGMT
jgi:hypothetical protein